MAKPSKEFLFDTEKVNIEAIGNARETQGYGEDEVLSHENLNDMMSNISDWIRYLSRITAKAYYVSGVDGDDDNEGTESEPFETIGKAIEVAEKYGRTVIFVQDIGYYDFSENVLCEDKEITIIGVENSYLKFTSYLETTNKIYGLNLKRCKITIAMEGVKVDGAANAGAAWSSSEAVCFYVNEGESEININCPVDFGLQSASSGKAIFIKQAYSGNDAKGMGKTKLNIYGNIDTNGNGYILDATGGLAEINHFGTMEEPENWFKNPRAYKYELGMVWDGSVTTFVFGGTKWTAGNFGTFEKTIDISNPFQDYFDLVYGSGNTIVEASNTGSETVLTVEIVKGDLMPLHFKHENTGTSTTTYGISLPEKIDNFIKTNF